MRCSSGKKSYFSETEVLEALIRSHIQFNDAAKNFYLCDDCREYHLTSRGDSNPVLEDPEVRLRIKNERREQEWMAQLGKKRR